MKMAMYSSVFFMNNASAPCEDILFDDSSTLAEESIEWGGCIISKI